LSSSDVVLDHGYVTGSSERSLRRIVRAADVQGDGVVAGARLGATTAKM